jgi:hypothetical protein
MHARDPPFGADRRRDEGRVDQEIWWSRFPLMLDMQVIVRLLDTDEQRLDYLHDQALCESLAAR